jgi:MFS family permease
MASTGSTTIGEAGQHEEVAFRRNCRKLLGAGLIGSSLEWYDFFIYATAAALVFGDLFFPNASPLTGTLLAFSTFWAGFIARPIGGLIFGHFGDKVGRKPALVTCLLLMGTATFVIGLLPTAESIGALAPVLLVALRFLQGIAVGGQWGGVTLLLTESAGTERKGFAGSFGQMGVPMGVILGNGVFLIVGALVSQEQFTSWGWRVPFLLSAVLVPLVMFIQLRIEETPTFQQLQSKSAEGAVEQAPVKEVLRTNKKQVLLGSGLLFGCNAFFYVSIAGVPGLRHRGAEIPRDDLLLVVLLAMAIMVPVLAGAGALSDRFGPQAAVRRGCDRDGAVGLPVLLAHRHGEHRADLRRARGRRDRPEPHLRPAGGLPGRAVRAPDPLLGHVAGLPARRDPDLGRHAVHHDRAVRGDRQLHGRVRVSRGAGALHARLGARPARDAQAQPARRARGGGGRGRARGRGEGAVLPGRRGTRRGGRRAPARADGPVPARRDA